MDELQRLHVEDLAYLAPELTLVIAAVVLSVMDLLMPRTASRTAIGWLALAALAVSGVFTVMQGGTSEPTILMNGSYRIDDFAVVMKLIFLAGTALTVLIGIGMNKERLSTDDVGEYYYFFLPATLGAMITASSTDMITLYVGLELLSITSYILVGFRKKVSVSGEAAFKYIVMGAISSAFILYGMSFLYGLSGSTNLFEVNDALRNAAAGNEALLYVSFFLMLAGLGFKVAAVPFHTWAPDVYQGSTTPVAAYLAVVSKAAGFALLFRLMYTVYFQVGSGSEDFPIKDDIFLSFAVLAALAMIVGNAMALRQSNMKRLLALSGVANAGYMLVPIVSNYEIGIFHMSGFAELVYYLAAYLLMNLGAFAALAIVSASSGNEELKAFEGLYHRAPVTAIAIIIIVLSLAGIPITGGFFGKLFILFGALQMKLIWLALIMIVTSAVAFYYYFGVIRQMFMRPGHGAPEVKVHPVHGTVLWLTAAASVVLGLVPGQILSLLENVFRFSTDFFFTK
ncbi:NADH-quinone oxidoreductase subunit N [Paenibacillus thermotolerans]|uniref:NADH-quinone oxidoreductase subunit N n=1 Tax=Paenibacillus thermotolerans TaxID=3027807 RepID=UPI00236792CD|nr:MULTISPECIES: NADH-quinone oxidoreductase subunit N [unclassified Paenibacillus]